MCNWYTYHPFQEIFSVEVFLISVFIDLFLLLVQDKTNTFINHILEYEDNYHRVYQLTPPVRFLFNLLPICFKPIILPL